MDIYHISIKQKITKINIMMILFPHGRRQKEPRG